MREAGPFGDADVLARARDTSVEGVAESGVLREHVQGEFAYFPVMNILTNGIQLRIDV